MGWSNEDNREFSPCPVHGRVEIVHHEVSKGPDPYDIEVLRCGHKLMWFGPAAEDCYIVDYRPVPRSY